MIKEKIKSIYEKLKHKSIPEETLIHNSILERYNNLKDKSIPKEMLIFNSNLERNKKIDLFKEMVHNIEFEPYAFCNRKCSFCPNKIINRTKNKAVFDMELYKKIVYDLKAINYSQTIKFARYCEPLSSRTILDYIRFTRHNLPNSYILITSNGDYLNEEFLNQLIDAGLNNLHISIYPSEEDNNWNIKKAKEKIKELEKKINRKSRIETELQDFGIWVFSIKGLYFYCQYQNLNKAGLDRGQTVNFLTKGDYIRVAPCYTSLFSITIDYNGAVMPCCNIRSDFDKHKPFVIDYVRPDNSIIDIFFNKKITEWRRDLATKGEKSYPCTKCEM